MRICAAHPARYQGNWLGLSGEPAMARPTQIPAAWKTKIVLAVLSGELAIA